MHKRFHILERQYRFVAPVLPQHVRTKLHALIDALTVGPDDHDMLEGEMAVIGLHVWPYRCAMHEWHTRHRDMYGEQLLRAGLSREAAGELDDYLAHDGRFQSLFHGRHMDFFSHDVRVELYAALVELDAASHRHAAQAANATESRAFAARVQTYKKERDALAQHLDALRRLAKDDRLSASLRQEVYAYVRGVEDGLAMLGPRPSVYDVAQSASHFHGRAEELAVRRRI